MEDDAFEDEQRRQNWFLRLLVLILFVSCMPVYVGVILAWNFVAWVFMAFAQVLYKCGAYVTAKAMELPGLICHTVRDRIWTALLYVWMSLYWLIGTMAGSASNFVAWAFVALAKVLNKCATYVTCKAVQLKELICHIVRNRIWTALLYVWMSLQRLICAGMVRTWNCVAWVFVALAKVLYKCGAYVTCKEVELRDRIWTVLLSVWMSLQAVYRYLVMTAASKLNEISSKVKGIGLSTNRLLVRAWNIILLGRNQQVIFQFGAPSVAVVPRDEEWEASRVLGGSSQAWKALVAQNNAEDDWMFQSHGIELYEYTLKVAAREEQAGKQYKDANSSCNFEARLTMVLSFFPQQKTKRLKRRRFSMRKTMTQYLNSRRRRRRRLLPIMLTLLRLKPF